MAIGTTGALIAGTVASAAIGASSANKAAKAQESAARDANETQRYIFDRSVELTEPQREIGQRALDVMAYEMGLGALPSFAPAGAVSATNIMAAPPEIVEVAPAGAVSGFGAVAPAQQTGAFGDVGGMSSRPGATGPAPMPTYRVGDQTFDTRDAAQAYVNSLAQPAPTGDPAGEGYSFFQESPGYQYRFDQGMEALERMAAARGQRFSGGTMEEAMRRGQGMASQEFNNWWNRLAGISQGGQQATGQQIQAGQNYANQYGQNAMAAGNAQAMGAYGFNNAMQGGFNNLFGILGMQKAGLL